MSKDSEKQKAQEAAENATPLLFGPDEMPERPDLVAMVRKGEHHFTGERLSRDQELCRSVCADILLGLSGRAIARKYKISRSSVLSIERVMRLRGEIEGVREHTLAQLDAVIKAGLDLWFEALIDGKIAPAQIPIPILAALDKRAQLEAGIVLGTGRTTTEITADDVAAAWEKLKSQAAIEQSKPVAIDTQSTGQIENAKQTAGLQSLDAMLDAVAIPQTAVSDPTDQANPSHLDPTDQPTQTERRKRGGGGRVENGGGGSVEGF